jgi:zinc D-Ala-D-Ala dipeptidase
MPLSEIDGAVHGVVLSLAYATPMNVTGAPIYRHARCYLHPDAEECLKRAVSLAGALGYRLKIFDAYRPPAAQWALWNRFPDPEFVADPRRGSPHSRGVAVDLTLIDGAGAELPMGTGFDDFTALAHHANPEVPVEAQRNRAILLGVMSAAGWDFYSKEWWHYQLFRARDYPLIDDSALPNGLM